MTALVTGWPSWASARSRRALRISAEISCGRYSWSPSRTLTSWPILRLIDLTVRSGASAHWLRAALPTSSLPSGDSPTNDGNIGSPSSAKTCGWPSRTRATSLFVVPRSMPTMISLMAIPSPGRIPRARPGEIQAGRLPVPRHAHLGEAEHPPVPQVAAPHLLDHLAGGPARPGHRLQDLHPLRVERLAGGEDRLQAVLPQRPLDPLHAHRVARQHRPQRLADAAGAVLGLPPLVLRLPPG